MARLRLETALLTVAALGLPALVIWGSGGQPDPQRVPVEVRLGERLFRDTRFAQPFAVRAAGRPLAEVSAQDPGAGLSCASCHRSEGSRADGARGARAFCDFTARSALPPREDGRTTTVRNTPTLRDIVPPAQRRLLLHFDGQFGSLEDLTRATLTGRSLGWLPDEGPQAVAHIARVLREDDGRDLNARSHGGGTYAQALAGGRGGEDLPETYRADVRTDGDARLVEAAARLIARYVTSLTRRADGTARRFDAPYDRFLRRNGLPERPEPGESNLDYGRRLRRAVLAASAPRDVGPAHGAYRTHGHPFRFAALERQGLLVFLAEPVPGAAPPEGVSPGGIGSCISCHAPPSFTDFRFHNVGTSQAEYDAVHGLGAFAKLRVPSLQERDAHPGRFLPPSARLPLAAGPFLAAPRRDQPGWADLGLWNVFANGDAGVPTEDLLEAAGLPRGPLADSLPLTIGLMRTPGLRNLGHSDPYFHAGHLDTLEGAVQHYRAAAFSARSGLVRNGAQELAGIDLALPDLIALAAFLRALDEDPP